ncbi:CA2+ K+ INDEPENDENT EXCHANGER [Salix purpurea]|uniref:CA2+ K+ INDEPENDENT EXCHANGER n=1 Tax=Salix purpurea TaxID=77065 RepID=A0A9Q0WAP9_SALPP|nr:CA2+ K+ INDEPENDENT EXCHANGER [Salix purpurea]
MAIFSTSRAKPKKSTIFLNISFIFLFLFYIATSYFLDQSNEPEVTAKLSLRPQEGLTKSEGCSGIHDYTDYKSKCVYIKSNIGCRSKGYINYLQIFYCTCGKFSMLGHAMLLLWLAVLFYLLGNTAADYFCPSLESLSKLLKLSPTIAGVTLLSLGNGAPDVFASIVSFTRSSNGDVGLNSILGGAFFVSSVVVGVISILTSPRQISVDKCSFIRDVCFFPVLSLLSALDYSCWENLLVGCDFFPCDLPGLCLCGLHHALSVQKKESFSCRWKPGGISGERYTITWIC